MPLLKKQRLNSIFAFELLILAWCFRPAPCKFPVSGGGAVTVGTMQLLNDLLTPVIYYGNKRHKQTVAWYTILYLRDSVEGAEAVQKETIFREIFPGWIDLWRPWVCFYSYKKLFSDFFNAVNKIKSCSRRVIECWFKYTNIHLADKTMYTMLFQ